MLVKLSKLYFPSIIEKSARGDVIVMILNRLFLRIRYTGRKVPVIYPWEFRSVTSEWSVLRDEGGRSDLPLYNDFVDGRV